MPSSLPTASQSARMWLVSRNRLPALTISMNRDQSIGKTFTPRQ